MQTPMQTPMQMNGGLSVSDVVSIVQMFLANGVTGSNMQTTDDIAAQIINPNGMPPVSGNGGCLNNGERFDIYSNFNSPK